MMRYIVGLQVAFELLLFIAVAGLVVSLVAEAVFAVGRAIRRRLWLRRKGIRLVKIPGMSPRWHV